MKKILVIIMLVMSLLMKPLFAPGTMGDVLRDIAAKQKEILTEKQRKLREQEAEKKAQQEEALKQQELQKKLDELKVKEEKAQQEKARQQEAATKKAQEEQEAAKRKKAAEDPRKNIAYAFGDLFAANKKYAAEDVKSGDALFKRSVEGLYDALKDFTFDELKKIVTGMELKPETQFMVLQNLIEAYADHSKAIDDAHIKVVWDFISALLETVNVDELQKFLMTEAGPKALHEVQVLLLPNVEAPRPEAKILTSGEKLFVTMVKFTEKLVEVLNKVSGDEQKNIAEILLNWVRILPAAMPKAEELLLAALKDLKADSLDSNNTIMLRDWLLVLRNSKNEMLLDALRSKYLKAAHANGTLQALREAILRLQGKVSSYEFAKLAQAYLKAVYADGKVETIRNALQIPKGVISFLELIKLQKVYLALITKPEALEHIGDVDIPLIVDAFRTVLQISDENQWMETQDFLNDLIIHLDTLIKHFETLRENLAGTAKFAEISEKYHISALQNLKAQLEGMVLPKGLWKSIADLFRSKKTVEPDITKWDQKLRARLMLNITDANYQKESFVSVPEFVKALQAFAYNYHFYEGSPEIQKVLLDDARKYLFNKAGRRLFDIAYTDVDPHQRSELYELIGLDHDLITLLDKQKLNNFRDFLLQEAVRATIDKKDKRYIQSLESLGSMIISTDERYRGKISALDNALFHEKMARHYPKAFFAYPVLDALSDKQFNELLEFLSSQNWGFSEILTWRAYIEGMTNVERLSLFNKLIESRENKIIDRAVTDIISELNRPTALFPRIDNYMDTSSYGETKTKILISLAHILDGMSADEFIKITSLLKIHDDLSVDRFLGAKINLLFKILPHMQNLERAKIVLDTIAPLVRNDRARGVFMTIAGFEPTFANLETASVNLEKRLKAQQESEAKAKAAAATSASSSSTSSASSSSAPSASASSSSANVTSSSSTSSVPLSMPAIASSTQARS